jgi:hypothetical protein
MHIFILTNFIILWVDYLIGNVIVIIGYTAGFG